MFCDPIEMTGITPDGIEANPASDSYNWRHNNDRPQGNGKSAELPILSGTHGPDVVDIRGMNKATGLFTYDPGFATTASCKSAITFIDGGEGVLLYRGYPIEQLAEHSTYLEVCYTQVSRKSLTDTPWCTKISVNLSQAFATMRTQWPCWLAP